MTRAATPSASIIRDPQFSPSAMSSAIWCRGGLGTGLPRLDVWRTQQPATRRRRTNIQNDRRRGRNIGRGALARGPVSELSAEQRASTGETAATPKAVPPTRPN